MARPPAPGLRVKKWNAGTWSEAQDAVVTEEPLQLMLDGAGENVHFIFVTRDNHRRW